MYIIVTGQAPGAQELSSTLLSVETSGVVKIISSKMPLGEKINNETIDKILCDQSDLKVGREASLLVQTAEGNIHILNAKSEENQLVLEKRNVHMLDQGETLHSISYAAICFALP